MAESKVEIWSCALDRIGETEGLETEDDDRLAARVCKRHYDRCRRLALEAYAWPFAAMQATLARPLGADGLPLKRAGWAYAYALPAGCLAPRWLIQGDVRIGLIGADQRIPFEIQSNDAGDGKLLVCDVAPDDFDVLEYTRDIDNLLMFSSTFEDALEWRLAAELALAIKQDAKLSNSCLQAYRGAVVEAIVQQMRARQDSPEPDAPSIMARR